MGDITHTQDPPCTPVAVSAIFPERPNKSYYQLCYLPAKPRHSIHLEYIVEIPISLAGALVAVIGADVPALQANEDALAEAGTPFTERLCSQGMEGAVA